MKVKKFKDIKLNEFKVGGYNKTSIETITVGEFIDILKKFDKDEELTFSLNGEAGYILYEDGEPIIEKFDERGPLNVELVNF